MFFKGFAGGEFFYTATLEGTAEAFCSITENFANEISRMVFTAVFSFLHPNHGGETIF